MAQKKHSLCHASFSKATNLVLPKPPLPVMGFAQAVHLLEKSSPKQSAQYGLSSLEVNQVRGLREAGVAQRVLLL